MPVNVIECLFLRHRNSSLSGTQSRVSSQGSEVGSLDGRMVCEKVLLGSGSNGIEINEVGKKIATESSSANEEYDGN